MRIHQIALLLGVGVTPGLVVAGHAGSYTSTILQDVGGQQFDQPVDLNAAGWIVGYSQTASGQDAVLWSPSGAAKVLQDVGGTGYSAANAINDSKQSVGSSALDGARWNPNGKGIVLQNPTGGDDQAFAINRSGQSVGNSGFSAVLWGPNGDATVLQDVGGSGQSEAVAINDSGQSVGFSGTSGGGQDAVLWGLKGSGTVLQDAGGSGKSGAVAINDSGESVGFSHTSKGVDAVLWSASGTATVLQDGGGAGYSQALAINPSGQSVGYSDISQSCCAPPSDAVLWSSAGTATVLRSVDGGKENRALAVNAAGESVGYSGGPHGEVAVLWSPTGKPTNLGAILGPDWKNTVAVGINHAGDIIGEGAFDGGQYGFLLTPNAAGAYSPASVPEPSVWAMTLLGFAAMGYPFYRSPLKARPRGLAVKRRLAVTAVS